ncbi:MAG: hypothetical protein WBP26_00900 [Candidatus Saccharimonadales bacterium]
MTQDYSGLVLPVTVVGRVDVNRLFREAELLDNFIRQDSVRQPGVQPKMPQTTRLMDDFCKTNQLNLLLEEQRLLVLGFLKYLKKSGPVMHLSFAVEASPAFMQKMVAWIRENIDAHAMILVGLAPGIVAGCVVRTTNRVFDFGLRQRFEASKPILIHEIKALIANAPAAQPVPAQPVVEAPQEEAVVQSPQPVGAAH